MQVANLLDEAATAAAGTALECRTSPFDEGKEQGVIMTMDGFTGTVKLQSSNDNSSWSDVFSWTGTTDDFTKVKSTVLKRYMRGNVTARTAGKVSLDLVAGS